MADDGKGKAPPGAPDAKATKEGAEAVKRFAAAEREFTNAVRPNIDALGEWDLGLKHATEDQESLTKVILEQIDAVKKHAREVGSLQSQFKDLGGAANSYLETLRHTISLTKIQETLIHKVQVGQKSYTASLQHSTESLGRATAENTRFIDAYSDSMQAARKTAIDFNLKMEDMEEHFASVYNALSSVTSAYPDMSKATADAANTAFKFSRMMGVDMAEAQEYLTGRLQNSTRSLDEIRVEMMAVSREADKYTNNLKKMGNEALQTGTVTRQGFLKVLKEIEQMFKGGMYTAAEGFAKTTSSILLKAKEMGFTPAEAQNMAGSFGKVFTSMSRFDNIFGARVAQHLGEIIKDVGGIQDEMLKKRLAPYAERARAGTLNVVDLKGIADAAAGSSEGMRILIKTFKESGMNPDVMRTVLSDSMGPGQQHQADLLVKLITENKMAEAFDLVGAGNEEQKETAKQELSLWEASFDQLLKEGQLTNKASYNSAIYIKKLFDTISAWFKDYPLLMAGIMAGAQLLGGGVGSFLGTRLGMGAMVAKGAVAPTLAGAAAPTMLGMGGAFVGGAMLGHKGGQYLTQRFASDETKRRLGEGTMGGEAGLGDLIGKSLGDSPTFRKLSLWIQGGNERGADMLKETTGIRGVLTDAHRKEYAQNEKQLELTRKNWDKLDDSGKEAYRQRNAQQNQLKKFIELSTSTPEQIARDLQERTEKASADLIKNMAGEKGVKKDDKASLAEAIKWGVAGTGRIGSSGMGGDAATHAKAFMASDLAKEWINKGFSPEEIQTQLMKELVRKQWAFEDVDAYNKAIKAKGGTQFEARAAAALSQNMLGGKMTGASAETLAAARAMSGAPGTEGGSVVTIQVVPNAGEPVENKFAAGADNKVRLKNPDTILDITSLPSYVAASNLRNRQKLR